MAASGNQPVSAENLAAALGVSASGSIGSQPICVDNLKAVLGNVAGTTLYDGEPVKTARLSRAFDGFDCYYCETSMDSGAVDPIRYMGVTTAEKLEWQKSSGYGLSFAQFYFVKSNYYNPFNHAFTFSLSSDGLTLTMTEGNTFVHRIVGFNFK